MRVVNELGCIELHEVRSVGIYESEKSEGIVPMLSLVSVSPTDHWQLNANVIGDVDSDCNGHCTNALRKLIVSLSDADHRKFHAMKPVLVSIEVLERGGSEIDIACIDRSNKDISFSGSIIERDSWCSPQSHTFQCKSRKAAASDFTSGPRFRRVAY